MKLSETLRSKWIELNAQNKNEACCPKGWCSVYADLPVYEGLYYSEITILEPKYPLPFENVVPHVRIGIGTKESNVELPIGADEYSYSYRDKDGCILNQGISQPYAQPYGINDTIGILLHLSPPKPKIKHKKDKDKDNADSSTNNNLNNISNQNNNNNNKDLYDYSQNNISQQMISNQSITSFQKIPLYQPSQSNNNNIGNNNNTLGGGNDNFYHSNQLFNTSTFNNINNTNNKNQNQTQIGQSQQQQQQQQNNQPLQQQMNMEIEENGVNWDSFVYFFKNGVNQGRAFVNMKEGFYYVGASLYMNARVKFNFGPDFQYPIDLLSENIIVDEDIILKPYDSISTESIPYNDIL